MDIEDGERIRIIGIEENYSYSVNIDANTSMPQKELLSRIQDEVEQQKLIKIKDPFSRTIKDSELSKVQIEKRNEQWNFIEKYWETYRDEILNKSRRNQRLIKISEESGISVSKVKKIFSRYWQRGMNKNALLPDYINSGGKGKEKKLSDIKVGRPKKVDYYGEVKEGINITDEVKRQFEYAINRYYINASKLNLKDVYMALLREFYSERIKVDGEYRYILWDEDRIPSYQQFYYWYRKNQNITKEIVLRESEKEFNLKHRVLLNNSTNETDGPGTRFQVDATIADVYLVSSLNRNRIIGRPIVYAIIDVFSRMITGIYVGLEGPSWLGAMMALDNMVTDKVKFCRQYGIEIREEQWPCHHLPEIIIADRGEFEGYTVENLINNLNVKIENTSPYRGDLKGIVERSFRTTNEKIKHKTPGAIQKEFRKRGDREYRLDAVLTLDEFTKIYINIVLNHNSKIIDKYPMEKEMLEDEIVPCPIQLWSWGLENKKGRLKTIDSDILRLNILPKGKANVSRAGIKFKGLSYSCDKAIKEQWFINSKINSVEIAYDPRDINQVYIPSKGGLDYEICYLTERDYQYKNCILEEIIFNQELTSELRDKHKREQYQNNIDLEKEIENIVKDAEKEKSKDFEFNKSKNSKLKGIKRNRTIEKSINREKEKFRMSDAKGNNNKMADVIKLPINQEKQESTTNNKLMDKIKKKRNEIGEQQRKNNYSKGEF